MGSDSHPTMTYPTQRQYERWKGRADDRNMSVAEWVECMTEAGLKKFDGTAQPDETVAEVRQQRNDLKAELRDARDRIKRLEDELHHGERGVIRNYVQTNPGATFDDIVQHIMDSAPSRVRERLDALEGDAFRYDDGDYYPADNDDGGGS